MCPLTDSSALGFTIKRSTTVHASAETVFRNLVENVGQWWDSAHTFSGDAKNLFMEPKADGCFCEHLPKGGSVRHMTILFWEPGKRLRLAGGLGPLQRLAVVGTMSWELRKAAESTEVEIVYTVGGYAPGGLQAMANPVEQVLGVQLQRFKTYAETGKTPQ